MPRPYRFTRTQLSDRIDYKIAYMLAAVDNDDQLTLNQRSALYGTINTLTRIREDVVDTINPPTPQVPHGVTAVSGIYTGR
jgi:hypothetical protein